MTEPCSAAPSIPSPPPSYEAFVARAQGPLSAFVDRIWAVKGSAHYQRETILPSGTLELMVNFGAPHRVLARGDYAEATTYKQCWIAGIQSRPLTIEAPYESDVLGIRFKPGGAHAFLPVAVDALTDDVIEGDLVFHAAVERLRSRLAEAPTRALQVRAAERWLMERFAPHEHGYGVVCEVLDALHRATFHVPIAALCDDLGLSNKHLITLFKRFVGLPPKAVARILRFHTVIDHLRTRATADLSFVAHAFEYYDQSHFIREFRYFSGVTPGQYFEQRTPEGDSLIAE